MPFPGYTYAEDGQANWVGHLITEHGPQSASQDPASGGPSPVLVYDYAKGGANVHGVVQQVNDGFMRVGSAGWKPEWAQWNSDDTIFSASPSHLTSLNVYNVGATTQSDLGGNQRLRVS